MPTTQLRSRRTTRMVVVAVLAAVTLLLTSCSPEQMAVLDRMNATRSQHGIPGLLASPHGMDKAQAWANHLAATGSLRHSHLAADLPENWVKLAENVGRGPSVEAVHEGFMRSAPHRANLLDPAFQWGGTGIATAPDGTVYVVQVFLRY